ncbi:Trpt1, partial [Symbiodinium sp. KB8]
VVSHLQSLYDSVAETLPFDQPDQPEQEHVDDDFHDYNVAATKSDQLRYLPPGSMYECWRQYRAVSNSTCSWQCFSKAWKEEFGHKLTSRNKYTVGICTTCVKHKLMLRHLGCDATSRLRQRHLYDRHLQAQYDDRKSIGTIGAAVVRITTPVVVDAIDQAKFAVPKSPLFDDHLFQQFVRPRLHVWGILVHGWGVYVAVSDADTSKGGSTLVDLLVFVLSKLRSKGVLLDKFDFCVQLDNTSSCNKNNVALAFAACCAHFKLLSSVRLCFLRVGHTHEDFGGWMRGLDPDDALASGGAASDVMPLSWVDGTLARQPPLDGLEFRTFAGRSPVARANVGMSAMSMEPAPSVLRVHNAAAGSGESECNAKMSVLNDVVRDLHQNGMPWLIQPPSKNGWEEKDRWESTAMLRKIRTAHFAVSLSKALAACLRHGHKPRLEVDAAGCARVQDVLSWPRVRELEATGGDLLEIVRGNTKQRYQLGLKSDGCRFIRAVQGHSREEVGEENLLAPVSEEVLPDTLLHGTFWHSYDSIQQRGLLPGKVQPQKGKGGRKGREGRQHVHFLDEAGGVSGKRESSTMIVGISTRIAVEQGVRFFISRNGVYLTPDEVPPICINSFHSVRTQELYDRDGELIPRSS